MGLRIESGGWIADADAGLGDVDHHRVAEAAQVCRYLVKDFGTSQSPKSTRQRDSRYCP
ncbi:MAG: hypothetical protein G8D28_05170, partial [gamma proteobacterium symbiont of Phacoides pectinatus]